LQARFPFNHSFVIFTLILLNFSVVIQQVISLALKLYVYPVITETIADHHSTALILGRFQCLFIKDFISFFVPSK
jgi:hypothetical protein